MSGILVMERNHGMSYGQGSVSRSFA
jgi:hypothetical protein